MKYNNAIAIQSEPKQYFQPKPFNAKTPQEAADWGKDVLFKSAANGLIWALQTFWPFFLFIFIVACIRFFGFYNIINFFKGFCGERKTQKAIDQTNKSIEILNKIKEGAEKPQEPPKDRISLKNILIPDEFGGTTQIDHILLTLYGIFVIETKNLSGWIFGSQYDEFWTIKNFHKTDKMQNPFRQNYKHIKCLSSLLNIEECYFINVVMIHGECEIKTMNKMPFELATNTNDLNKIIFSRKAKVFNEDDLKDIHQMILEKMIPQTAENIRKHIMYCHNIHK
ncbi:MAG: NERD domain-containing protein [Victivallales bacterium]|nr:NERD domain-containing protein [Victivallales bacterium]